MVRKQENDSTVSNPFIIIIDSLTRVRTSRYKYLSFELIFSTVNWGSSSQHMLSGNQQCTDPILYKEEEAQIIFQWGKSEKVEKWKVTYIDDPF
jgi:hypothetical protein